MCSDSFIDWFLGGLFGCNIWGLQYALSLSVWATVGVFAIYRLAVKIKFDRFAFYTLIICIWYLSIQTHWVMKEAFKHPGYVEWWWSMFESFTAILLGSFLVHQDIGNEKNGPPRS